MKRFAIIILAVALTGCGARQTTITNLPAGVTQAQVQAWDTAVKNLHAIAIANSDIRQAVITLHATVGANGQPVIPSGAAYVAILNAVGRVDQAENDASAFLSKVPNDWSLSTKQKIDAYMTAISQATQSLITQGAIGISNPSSQQQVTTLIGSITNAVNIILAL